MNNSHPLRPHNGMMTDRNFKDREKLDKAAALVALSTDKGGQAGRCLLAEELAAMVDGRCNREQRALFLRHLGGCDQCYRQWLFLQETSDRREKRRRSYRLTGMKKFGYLSSALALAASVVVYLHIVHPPSLVQDKSLHRTEAIEPVGQSAGSGSFSDTKNMADAVEKEQDEVPAPIAQPAPAGEALKSERVPETTAGPLNRQPPGALSSPASEALPQPARRASPAKTAGDGQMAGTVAAWMQRLQKNCLADNRDLAFWASMHLQGKKMLETQAGSISEEQQHRVAAALELLQAMATKPAPDQCRRLLAVLAEEPKSR